MQLWSKEKKNLHRRETYSWQWLKDFKSWMHNEKTQKRLFETLCCQSFKEFSKQSHHLFKRLLTEYKNTQNLLQILCWQSQQLRDWLLLFLDLHLHCQALRLQFEFWVDQYDESFEQSHWLLLLGRIIDDEFKKLRKTQLNVSKESSDHDLIKSKHGDKNTVRLWWYMLKKSFERLQIQSEQHWHCLYLCFQCVSKLFHQQLSSSKPYGIETEKKFQISQSDERHQWTRFSQTHFETHEHQSRIEFKKFTTELHRSFKHWLTLFKVLFLESETPETTWNHLWAVLLILESARQKAW